MTAYYRPIVRFDLPRPEGALPLAGGRGWFTEVVEHRRDAAPLHRSARDLPEGALDRLTAPRAPVAGLAMDRTHVMGILNVTPDSFSDGGQYVGVDAALAQAARMVADGAEILDIGGESTRPGAQTVPPEEEIARIVPAIRAIAAQIATPISIDTRKRVVAEAAVEAGGALVNDVSGLTYDPTLAGFCAASDLPVCVMHTLGGPETMQDAIRYDDVLLDVYDFLEAQVQLLEAAGLPRSRIVVDPGIGFGKTITHNLTLLNGASLFHGLGCAVLVGASRKGFIGTISGTPKASDRMPGSVAVALAMAAQGIQVVRVHDVAETAQALSVWTAISAGDFS